MMEEMASVESVFGGSWIWILFLIVLLIIICSLCFRPFPCF